MVSVVAVDREALDRTLQELAATSPEPDGVLPALGHLADAAKAVLGVDGAAITLAHEAGSIGWVVVTDPIMELLEQLQQDAREGPSVDAYATNQVVMSVDLAAELRWRPISAVVGEVGVRSVLSVPIRLDAQPVGTLNVYGGRAEPWSAAVVEAAEEFAGVAADLVRTGAERSALTVEVAQLQHALAARVLVEQAKGVLVASQGLTLEEAYERLRVEARSSRRRVAELAREFIQAAQRARLAALAAQDQELRAAHTRARAAEHALAALEADQARTRTEWETRVTRADARDRAADERDRQADERERVADERERVADERERAADERDQRAR